MQHDKRAVAAATTRSSEDIAIDSCRRDTRLRHRLTLPAAAATTAAAAGVVISQRLTADCRRLSFVADESSEKLKGIIASSHDYGLALTATALQ